MDNFYNFTVLTLYCIVSKSIKYTVNESDWVAKWLLFAAAYRGYFRQCRKYPTLCGSVKLPDIVMCESELAYSSPLAFQLKPVYVHFLAQTRTRGWAPDAGLTAPDLRITYTFTLNRKSHRSRSSVSSGCWPSVVDYVLTLNQQWMNASCYLANLIFCLINISKSDNEISRGNICLNRKHGEVQFSYPTKIANFYPHKVVDRGSESQLQLG